MKKHYVKFNYSTGDFTPKGELDLSDWRVKALVKSLIRGGGSTSETIVVGFVMDDPQKLVNAGYRNLEEAWQRLDQEQRNLIPLLRELACRDAVDMSYAPFSLYQRMVDKELDERLDNYEEQNRCDRIEIPKADLELLAENATKHVASILSTDCTQLIYEIKELIEEY